MNDKEFLIAQLFGCISLAFGTASLMQKNDLRLKQFMCGLNISHSVHFFLLGAYPAMIASLVSTLRTALSLRYQSHHMAIIFIALNWIIGWPYLNHITDALPLVGSSIGTYAVFSLKGVPMRIAFFFGGCCWLVNNILVGSLGGTLLEILLITLNLKTLLKLRRNALNLISLKEL